MIKLISAILLMIPITCYSNSHLDFTPQLDISGYIGYRYIWSSIGAAPVESYPELGLLLNYNINTHISSNIQLNVNRGALEHNLENILTYGFITYQNSFADIPFEINIGKLRHDFQLYNANIVNPSTRPSGTVAPQAIYWNNLSSTITSGYGISAGIFWGDFEFKYTIDKHIVQNEKEEALMWTGGFPFPLQPYFGSHQLVNVNYKPNDLPIIFKGAWSRLKHNRDSNDVQFLSFGIEYDNNEFSASAEVLVVRPPTVNWSDFDRFSVGYSISGSYYIYDDLEVYANANVYENSGININDNDGVNRWKDFSIGITKYYKSFEFKADIHKVYGGRTLRPGDWTIPGLDDWWYVGTSLVFHF